MAYLHVLVTARRMIHPVQAIRAQLQQAVALGGEASASAYSQAAEEGSQEADRSIFEGGAINALYR